MVKIAGDGATNRKPTRAVDEETMHGTEAREYIIYMVDLNLPSGIWSNLKRYRED